MVSRNVDGICKNQDFPKFNQFYANINDQTNVIIIFNSAMHCGRYPCANSVDTGQTDLCLHCLPHSQ